MLRSLGKELFEFSLEYSLNTLEKRHEKHDSVHVGLHHIQHRARVTKNRFRCSGSFNKKMIKM